jgi:phage host-nuclease inhibitor protein Gam
MSDKTTAALAAEQADAEATTTQETELLPAATLDELEQVDLGTVAEGERAPFRITDDRCADWAIRKIADERSEYDRLKALADEQIAAINEKVAAARKRMENGTSYLTSCLADFFATVPHKETKTTEKYRLLSGTLTFKKGTTKTKLDETKLVPWLKANGYGELVRRHRNPDRDRRDRGGRHRLRDPGHLHGRRVRRHRYGRNQENRGGRCCGPS